MPASLLIVSKLEYTSKPSHRRRRSHFVPQSLIGSNANQTLLFRTFEAFLAALGANADHLRSNLDVPHSRLVRHGQNANNYVGQLINCGFTNRSVLFGRI